MPWFEYEGQCPNGTAIGGRLEATDREAALQTLRESLRITVNDLRSAATPATGRLIPLEDFVFFNEQLASMAQAGIALDEGLRQLARDVQSRRLKTLIENLAADLQRGEPLERAVARYEHQMPVLYSRVIRAGIESGQLPATLLALNQHLRLVGETRRILWETLSYPLIVLVVAFALLSAFMLLIAPKFKEMFKEFGTALPGLTILLMDIADAYPVILMVTVGVVAGMVLLWHLLRLTPAGRRVRERLVSALPLVGRIYRESLISRFVRSVATCVQAGVTLPESVRLAAGATASECLESDAEQLARAAERGESLLTACQFCRWVPGLFGYVTQVAVSREALPHALAQLSRTYEARATHLQAMLRVLLLPMLIVVVGGLVMTIIVGLFLPLVTLINCVSAG